MKKPALLVLFFLFPCVLAYSNSFKPIPINGFNQDVVAHDTPSGNTTSITFDEAGYVFYVAGFPGGNYGMPADGVINSLKHPEVTYQLADYTQNNCLLLLGINSEGTLTLEDPGEFNRISLLASSGQGASDVEVTLNYIDGSTQDAGTFTFPDWHHGADYAIKGLDRIMRSPSTSVFPDGNSENPRLYDFIIEDVNPEKILESISFRKTTGVDSRAGVFAASGVKPPPVPLTPLVFVLFGAMVTLFVVYRSRLW